MGEQALARFRADPARVRVSVRRRGSGWAVSVAERARPGWTSRVQTDDPDPGRVIGLVLAGAEVVGTPGVSSEGVLYPHPMRSQPKTWRYDLPSVGGEGWAVVILTSDGFFAAVSDFGNYAFRWTSWGEGLDFREFFAGIGDDYLLSKIADEVFDAEATERLVRRAILAARRARDFSREEAREEWDCWVDGHQGGGEDSFWQWTGRTDLGDAAELVRYQYPGDARGFAGKILPRLREMIREQMEGRLK